MSNSSSTILITAPNYDMMTRYLSAWAGSYAEDMLAHNHQVHVLKEDKVNKTNFHGYINKNHPNVIIINGHGAEDRIAGHEHDIIIESQDAGVFAGSEIYALSCKSASVLGKVAVSLGATGYIGYSQDFILVSQPSKSTHPIDDETAALFLEPSKVIAISLAKGHGTDIAYSRGVAAYNESIRKALNSDVQSDDDKYIPYLMWNKQFLTNCKSS